MLRPLVTGFPGLDRKVIGRDLLFIDGQTPKVHFDVGIQMQSKLTLKRLVNQHARGIEVTNVENYQRS